jgi:hypothetical protein
LERLGGEEDRKVMTASYQSRFAPARFRLPNHDYVEPPVMRMIGRSTDIRRLPKFSSAELGKLPTGSALLVTKGRVLQKFTRDPAGYGAAPTPIAPEDATAALHPPPDSHSQDRVIIFSRTWLHQRKIRSKNKFPEIKWSTVWLEPLSEKVAEEWPNRPFPNKKYRGF